jgi:hypothetical protein
VAALGGAAKNFDIVVTDAAASEQTEHSAIFQGP